MEIVRDVYRACNKTVNKVVGNLNKEEITNKYDLAMGLCKSIAKEFTVVTPKGVLGITLVELAHRSDEPLFIVKHTFTKKHGLKHCILRLNPKLEDMGLTMNTTKADAIIFLSCLYEQKNREFLLNRHSEYKDMAEETLKEAQKSKEFIDTKVKKLSNKTFIDYFSEGA